MNFGGINTRCWVKLIQAVVFLIVSQESFADGFAIKDQSPSAAAKAFAGAASTADDISVIFFNPAGLTYLSGTEAVVVANLIAPTTELKSSSGTLPTALGGGAAGGRSTIDDVSSDAFVGAAYGMFDIHPDVKIGFGLNSPFGLATSYDPTWQGRFHAVTSKMRTFNFNPVVAYRIVPWLSVGAGLQVNYTKTRLTNAVLTTTGEGFIDNDGDDIGYGWTFGILAEPRPGSRIGVSYRSHIAHRIEGDARIYPAVGSSVLVGGSGDLDLPETVRIGLSQDLGDDLSLHFGAAWRRWSRFDVRTVEFASPVAVLSGVSQLSVDADWKNTWFVSVGATYRPTENWTLHAGFGVDETPVPDHTRGPGIPGANGWGVSFGAGYRVNDWANIVFAYTHIVNDDTAIGVGSALTGNLSAEIESQTNVLSLQGRIQF